MSGAIKDPPTVAKPIRPKPHAADIRWRITCRTVSQSGGVLDLPSATYEGSPAECFRRARWWCEDQFANTGVRAFDLTMEAVE